MLPRDATLLLDTLKATYGLAMLVVRDGEGDDGPCRVQATDPSGHTWVIRGEDLGGAALELAGRLGFDVADC